MISYRILVILFIAAIIMVGGCSTSSTSSIEPLAGSWNYQNTNNGTSITSTLVFAQDGNFNGYMLGLLSLSGHWTKVNATAYNVYYGNKTILFIMNNDKTQIWDGTAPQQIFTKQ
jgi:hypothetical protein